MNNEFDIRHISKEIRTLRFLTNIILTTDQRKIIPYFKQHILNYDDSKHCLKYQNLSGQEIEDTLKAVF